jgi:hypothetical protein
MLKQRVLVSFRTSNDNKKGSKRQKVSNSKKKGKAGNSKQGGIRKGKR